MKSYAPGAATLASLLDVSGDALVLEAGLFAPVATTGAMERQ